MDHGGAMHEVDTRLVGEWGEQCVERYYTKTRRDSAIWDVRRTALYHSTADLDIVKRTVHGVALRLFVQVKATVTSSNFGLPFERLERYVVGAEAMPQLHDFQLAWVSLPLRCGFIFGLDHLRLQLNHVKSEWSILGFDYRRAHVKFRTSARTLEFYLTPEEIARGNLIATGSAEDRNPVLDLPIEEK